MKNRLVMVLVAAGILLVLGFMLFTYAPKPYEVEGVLLDASTGNPLADVAVKISMNEHLRFPFDIFTAGKWSHTETVEAYTDHRGRFSGIIPPAHSSVFVERSFTVVPDWDDPSTDAYEYVSHKSSYHHADFVFELYPKQPPEAYVDQDCVNNGYFWSGYFEQCYADYASAEKKPSPDRSCNTDEDCYKICPYGCYNINQEYDDSLDWFSGISNCEEARIYCSCLNNECMMSAK